VLPPQNILLFLARICNLLFDNRAKVDFVLVVGKQSPPRQTSPQPKRRIDATQIPEGPTLSHTSWSRFLLLDFFFSSPSDGEMILILRTLKKYAVFTLRLLLIPPSDNTGKTKPAFWECSTWV